MDVFHSVKSIDRVPLSKEAAGLALTLATEQGLEMSNALTCAVAISEGAHEIHTLYKNLLKPTVVAYLKKERNIIATKPPNASEITFPEPGLEKAYQDTLQLYRERKLNLPDQFHV